MFNFFSSPHEELNAKLRKLEDKISQAQPLFGSRTSKDEWNGIFELCAEIATDFKNVKYPTRHERDMAWQQFYNLRDKAYKLKNTQFHDHSKIHFNELMSEISACDYDSLA